MLNGLSVDGPLSMTSAVARRSSYAKQAAIALTHIASESRLRRFLAELITSVKLQAAHRNGGRKSTRLAALPDRGHGNAGRNFVGGK